MSRELGRIWRRLVSGARLVPLAGWVCAAVAILNAVSWSFITPPFQVPDEPSHFAYVKQLAESHALPSSSSFEYSREEFDALGALHEGNTSILPPAGAISSVAQQRRLREQLAAGSELAREGSPSAGGAAPYPPLYYALEAIPYTLASGGNLLTRLEWMRLLSALFGGLTAMFVFLFVREALPARRPAWLAGGLGVAFMPLLGFMSGALNPDSLLFALSAALFWAFARAFRHGFSYRHAATIGAIAAAGLLTKPGFLGLLPGVLVGLGLLGWQLARRSKSYAYRAFALGAGIAVAPIVVLTLIDLSSGESRFNAFSGTSGQRHGLALAALSYMWEVFLPRLPGMHAYHAGVLPTTQVWLDGLVGRYGWGETSFATWAYDLATILGLVVLLACGRALFILRETARQRVAELAVYGIMSLGLLVLIAGASYVFPETETFTEARYLLPLLALGGAGLGLATRALPRRWESAAATAIVLALIADDLFSQLLVVARYYG